MSTLQNADPCLLIPDEAAEENRQAVLVGGAVLSTHIAVFSLFGLIPAFFLNLYMKKRIRRFERGLSKLTLGPHIAGLNLTSFQPVQVLPRFSMPEA